VEKHERQYFKPKFIWEECKRCRSKYEDFTCEERTAWYDNFGEPIVSWTDAESGTATLTIEQIQDFETWKYNQKTKEIEGGGDRDTEVS